MGLTRVAVDSFTVIFYSGAIRVKGLSVFML